MSTVAWIAAVLTLSNLILALLVLEQRYATRDQQRRHDRRVDELLNRLAHATGRTWVPAPVEDNHDEGPVAHALDLVDADQELP